jgi:hypothetical protein
MSKRKHVFKWFSAWNDNREELWLEQMAGSGWHLISGPIVYCFEQGAPAQVRYRLDYRSNAAGLDEYVNLCRDAGWERVFQFAGWQYFRTASPDAPEIYTDSSSRIAKYERLWVVAVLLSITTMAGNIAMAISPATGLHSSAFFGAYRWFIAALCVVWVYALARLAIHIRNLKRNLTNPNRSA